MAEETITNNINKPIVLVGLMGAGKTSVGERLAKRLDIPFIDADQEIEKESGCTITEIFSIFGEDYFRKLEEKVISKLLDQPPHVLATGGGAFMNERVRNIIKERAISIWLRAELDVLLERVERKNTRPLLETGDKREILEALMKKRYPIYSEADLVVDSSNGPHYKVVDEIIWKL